MIFYLCIALACFQHTEEKQEDTRSVEEREEELQQRTKDLAQRWEEHSKKREAKKEEQQAVLNEQNDTTEEEREQSKIEQMLQMKDSVTKTAQDLYSSSQTAKFFVDATKLALDVEAERLRQDFDNAVLNIVEVGNHLECTLSSKKGELRTLSQQKYEVYWWYNGTKVQRKASQYCSGATLGIGLNADGPSCPHHIKGAFYPYMVSSSRRADTDRFQCEIAFPFSMNAKIQKYLADNPFPNIKSKELNWSRWPELKKQRGGPWEFEGTELDCGKDGPRGHRCHLIEEEWP